METKQVLLKTAAGVEFIADADVPPPWSRRGGTRTGLTDKLRALPVGYSLLVDATQHQTGSITRQARYGNDSLKFTTCRVSDNQTRIWRIA